MQIKLTMLNVKVIKMKKIKVLIEGISQNLGGIEIFVHNLYENLDKQKYEISFLVDKNLKVVYFDEYKKDGCKFFYVENRKKNYFKYLSDLKEIYTKNQFDIIHINVMSYSLFEKIIYACKYSNSKVIVHSHGMGYKKGYYKTRFIHFIGKQILKNKQFYKIACGEKAGKYMFGNNKFTIINNGIDFDKFTFSSRYRQEIRDEFKIDNNIKLIGIVAAFFPVKNHTFLIDVFKEYNKLNSNSKLFLVGEGPLKSIIKEKVKEYDLENNVIFAGKREDANKIYSAFDLYVIPSISEGFGISICEAQINGLKCYTSTSVEKGSNISGNVEFISLEKSAKYWAEQMIQDDERDIDVLNKISDKYSLKKSCESMCEYYENIV